MNFLTDFIKRIEIIAFIFGFVAVIYGFFFPARYFIAWHVLPSPPEPGAKIVATNHMGDITIETFSKKKFLCNIDYEKECWTELESNYRPLNLGKTLCSQDCLDKHTVQMMMSSYEFLFFARPSTLYALHDDGNVYVKQTGVVFWPGYVMAVIFGVFCASIAVLGKHHWWRKT